MSNRLACLNEIRSLMLQTAAASALHFLSQPLALHGRIHILVGHRLFLDHDPHI